MDNQILYKDECYAIQGAVFEVYKEMGCGFLESVYQECLEKELKGRVVPFESQKWLDLSYKGEPLEQKYKADLVCYGTMAYCLWTKLRFTTRMYSVVRAIVG